MFSLMKRTSLNRKIGLLGLFFAISLCGCDSNNKHTNTEHKHSFNYSTLTWDWEKSSIGYSVKASMFCTSCNETITQEAIVSNAVSKQPTCKETGERKYTAKVQFGQMPFSNSKTFTIPVAAHKASEVYETTESTHTIRCLECGDVIHTEAHDFDSFMTDIEPQIGLCGSKHRNCKICSYKDIQVIPYLMPDINQIKELIDKIPNNLDDINAYSYDAIYDAFELFDYLDEEGKTTLGTTYVNKMVSSKQKYDSYYAPVVKASPDVIQTTNLGTADYSLTNDYFSSYGKVLKMATTTATENWNEYKLQKAIVSDAYEVRFAVYVSQPTDISLSTKQCVSNVYDIVNGVFTTKTASQVKYTLAVNTWNEFVIPAKDFEKIEYIALYGTNGYQYGVTHDKPGYITSMFCVKNDYYRLNATQLINLIDALPASNSVTAYDYSKLKLIQTSLDLYATEELPSITNLTKYNQVKEAWENKYALVYDPNVNGLPSGCGGSKGSSGSFKLVNDDTYGRCLAINAKFDNDVANSVYFQLYFYGFKENHYNATDKLIFSIKSPFDTVAGTSQTLWIGADATKVGQNLTPNGWKQVYGTGASLNTNGELATSFANRSISLQRYHAKNKFGSYEGTYLLTCIFAEKGN